MRGLVAVALLILVLVGAGFGWIRWANRAPSDSHETVRFVVEPGTTARLLGQRLEAEGIVRSAFLFETWLRARDEAGSLHAGTYELRRDLPMTGVAEILLSGRTVLVPVTVPEGLRLEEVAGSVSRGLGIDSTAFVAEVTDPALAESLGLSSETLEGYLFPETYLVDPSMEGREMARLMVEHFWGVFTPSWRARAESLGRSVHEIVTLASIVEEEARVPDERPIIAGVFWNRLARGMALEADPTVQYALGGHRERVLYRDLEVDSPYNTYRNAGLPPGPIASPGRASLEATLFPDSVPYLFFFATGENGRHTFSRSLAEHNRKRRQLGR